MLHKVAWIDFLKSYPKDIMPLVSVIIPTFQRAATLLPALQSVLAQTWTDYEIIVADDGSTDNTVEILEPFRDRIIYSYESNKGVSAARNRGAQIARGKYLAFLDSDDLWAPRKLELQMPLLEQQPEIGWVYCDMDYFGRIGGETVASSFVGRPPTRGWILKHLFLSGCPMHSPTLVVRKELFARSGGYDESLRVYEDHDLYFRLAERAPADYVDEILVHCRREGRSQPKRPLAVHLLTNVNAKRRALQNVPTLKTQMTHQEFHRGYVVAINELAVAYAEEGDLARARTLFRECIDHEPSWLKPRLYTWGLRVPKIFLGVRGWLAQRKHRRST